MRQLPQELLDDVVDIVAEEEDALKTLINCRAAAREFNIRSREYLFSSITLRPKRSSNDEAKTIFSEDALYEFAVADPSILRSIKDVKIILSSADRSKTLVALLSQLNGPDSNVTSLDLSADRFEDWNLEAQDRQEIIKLIFSGRIQKLAIAQILGFPLKAILAKLPASITDLSLTQVITGPSTVLPTVQNASPGAQPRLRRLAIDEFALPLLTRVDSAHFSHRNNMIGSIQELVLLSPKTIGSAAEWSFVLQHMGQSLRSLSVFVLCVLPFHHTELMSRTGLSLTLVSANSLESSASTPCQSSKSCISA